MMGGMNVRFKVGMLGLALAAGMEAAMASEAEVAALEKSNDGIRRWTTENGLTVLMKRDPSAPVVAIQYWVGAGAIHEGQWLGGGLSHYLEHMVFKGTERRGPGAISQEVADAGGEINAYTSNDRTVFHVVMPSEKAELGLDILTDAVFHPTFPEEEWKREREVVLREVAMGEDDPGRVMSKLSMEETYRVHPYRVPIIGWKDILTKMGREELKAYHEKHYSPDNMILSIAGDFDPEAMAAAVKRQLAGVERRSREPVYVPQEPRQTAERVRREEGNYGVTRISWTFHGVATGTEDMAALDLLAGVTGSGRSSDLARRLQEERKLATSVEAWNYTPQDPGVFGIYAECAPENETELIAAIREEVERWKREGFDEAALERARAEVLVASVKQLATAEGQAASMAAGEYYAGDPRRTESYLAEVGRVTTEDLRRMAEKYLTRENGTWVILAPAGSGTVEVRGEAAKEAAAPTMHRLENGVRVVVLENDRLPLVYMAAYLGGGQLGEKAGEEGSAKLAASLLTRGTKRHGTMELAELLERKGIALSGTSGRNTYGMNGMSLASEWETLAEALGECLTEATFPEEETAAQIVRQRAGLRQENERPMARASQLMRDAWFPGHPYQWSLFGREESLDAMTRETVADYHARHLKGGNLVVAVFGAVKEEAVLAKLSEVLGGVAPGEAPKWPALPEGPKGTARTEAESPFQQTLLLRTMRGLRTGDPRDTALGVVLDALSGMSSDLFAEVRDKRGLAYYTGATQNCGPVGGLVIVYAGTTEEGVGEVERLVESERERLVKEGPREDEISRAVEQQLVDVARMRQDGAAVAQSCALDELLGLGYEYTLKTAERLKSLDPEAVRKTAAELLGAEESVTVVLHAAPGAAGEEDGDEGDGEDAGDAEAGDEEP